MSARATIAAAASALVVAACAAAAPRVDPASAPPIAGVHARKCGACHAPPEPGTRSRAALEAAFARHNQQNRVRLTSEQWAEMVDYLANTKANEAAFTR